MTRPRRRSRARTKVCTACASPLPPTTDHFAEDVRTPDGLAPRCLVCVGREAAERKRKAARVRPLVTPAPPPRPRVRPTPAARARVLPFPDTDPAEDRKFGPAFKAGVKERTAQILEEKLRKLRERG